MQTVAHSVLKIIEQHDCWSRREKVGVSCYALRYEFACLTRVDSETSKIGAANEIKSHAVPPADNICCLLFVDSNSARAECFYGSGRGSERRWGSD